MLFYRNESSLDEMFFQCFLADKSANQAAHQSSSNNDYQHGNRSDIEHSLNVLRGNIVFLHCANKRTLKKFDEVLNAQLLKCANKGWDVYFWNQDNMLIGYNDDTDILAGIPMSTVYPTVTQYPTSSAKSAMTVSFSHEDVEDSQLHFDYVQLDFNPKNFVKGLVDVVFQKLEAENTYKIVEVVGGYDRTEEFGSLIADGAAEVMNNVTSATYSDGIITIVPKAGAVPSLKAPSVLYEKGIRGIEQVS